MTTWEDLSIDLLPPLLQEFVRLIGLQATMAMVKRYGGVRIYIPANPKPDHQLVQVVGWDNLVKLSEAFGAQPHFQLPKAKAALLAIRDARIRAEYQRKPVRALASEYQLTERQIVRILSSHRRDSEQSSLFS